MARRRKSGNGERTEKDVGVKWTCSGITDSRFDVCGCGKGSWSVGLIEIHTGRIPYPYIYLQWQVATLST